MAQTSAAETDATAAIEHGVQLRQAGNDDAALAEFRRADRVFPSPRAKAQIALAEQALGQWIAAEHDLQLALAATGDPWIERNRAALTQALTQIGSRLGWLEVRTETAGAQVYVNEQLVGTAPLSEHVRVAVGTVTIELQAHGFVTQRRSIEMTSGGRMREVFTLTHEATQTNTSNNTGTTNTNGSNGNGNGNGSNNNNNGNGQNIVPPPPPPPRGLNLPIGGIVVASVGAVSLISSGIFGALRGGALGACPLNNATNTLECPDAASTARARSGETWTTLTNVTLVGGSLLLVGGGAWMLAGMLGRSSQSEPTPRAQVYVVPSIAANTVGLSIFGQL